MIPKLLLNTTLNLDNISYQTKSIQQLSSCMWRQGCTTKPSICTIKQV